MEQLENQAQGKAKGLKIKSFSKNLQSKDNQIIYFEEKIRERNNVCDIYRENDKSQG